MWIFFDAFKSPNKGSISKRSGISFTLSSYNPFNDDFGDESGVEIDIFNDIYSLKDRTCVLAIYERNSEQHATLEAVRSADNDFLKGRRIFNRDGSFVRDEFGHTFETALAECFARYDMKKRPSIKKSVEKMIKTAEKAFASECKGKPTAALDALKVYKELLRD